MHTNHIHQFTIPSQPFYIPLANEIEIFNAAYAHRIAILLKGPTGCGKTRFMEYMSWSLKQPLITISCHDDLTTSDLLGRYLIIGGETKWVDGPLTRAVRAGGICYLDEVVEARKDTTVVIHPLTDNRRILPIEKTGEWLSAHPDFYLGVSYNPGYQSILKDLKQSTRQRFVSIEFDYPKPDVEANIIETESGLDTNNSILLVKFAHMTRNLKGNGLQEGASTRLLVHAAQLITTGISANDACRHAISETLSDDDEILRALNELSHSLF